MLSKSFNSFLTEELSGNIILEEGRFVLFNFRENEWQVRFWFSSEENEFPDEFNSKENIIELWQSAWQEKPALIKSLLQARFGSNKRIHGRKTKAELVSNEVAKIFLLQNHLFEPLKGKTNLALMCNEEVVALAVFSRTCPIHRNEQKFLSAELLRFCTLKNHYVMGGLSKLLEGYFQLFPEVDDIMTYADKSWGVGKGFEKIGFILEGELAPKKMRVTKNAPLIWSKGSYKYVYYRK